MLSLRHKISPLARSVNTAAAQKQVEEVYLVSCARTPLGSMGGKLKVRTVPIFDKNITSEFSMGQR